MTKRIIHFKGIIIQAMVASMEAVANSWMREDCRIYKSYDSVVPLERLEAERRLGIFFQRPDQLNGILSGLIRYVL